MKTLRLVNAAEAKKSNSFSQLVAPFLKLKFSYLALLRNVEAYQQNRDFDVPSSRKLRTGEARNFRWCYFGRGDGHLRAAAKNWATAAVRIFATASSSTHCAVYAYRCEMSVVLQ